MNWVRLLGLLCLCLAIGEAQLVSSAGVHGQILENGKPVENIAVWLFKSHTPLEHRGNDNDLFATVMPTDWLASIHRLNEVESAVVERTNADGRFAFKSLEPADYWLIIVVPYAEDAFIQAIWRENLQERPVYIAYEVNSN